MSEESLRLAWERHANAWVQWARTPDHDVFFWRFGLAHLLELLPLPGRLCVDIGCGEGRLTRILRDRGYNVAGFDGAPSLAAAAASHGEATPVACADAAALPVRGRAADLAISYMVLQDVDDVDSVVREAARVLDGGGRFVAAFIHPLQSWLDIDEPLVDGAFDASTAAGPWVVRRSYFEPARSIETMRRNGLEMTFTSEHRPLERYMRAFEDAGLLIEAVREPVPDREFLVEHPKAERFVQAPWAVFVRAVRALWAA